MDEKIIIICKLIEDSTKDKKKINIDTDLLEENILDSITFVNLVNKIEKIFRIKFDLIDLSVDNFRNVYLISEMIDRKYSELNN